MFIVFLNRKFAEIAKTGAPPVGVNKEKGLYSGANFCGISDERKRVRAHF